MRVKRGRVNVNKHKKVLKITKGHAGGRGTFFKAAMQSMMRALKRAYTGRKVKKRDFRALWITRINAATRSAGSSYANFMNGLKKANVDINRKMLAEIAVADEKAFAQLLVLSSN
jgi:large subunit ribosomal protein L20